MMVGRPKVFIVSIIPVLLRHPIVFRPMFHPMGQWSISLNGVNVRARDGLGNPVVPLGEQIRMMSIRNGH